MGTLKYKFNISSSYQQCWKKRVWFVLETKCPEAWLNRDKKSRIFLEGQRVENNLGGAFIYRKVASRSMSLLVNSSTPKDFQTVYEREIWWLCTVTFGPKSLELNSWPNRGAFCHFPFRWIYYYGSNKSTKKETGITHLCGPVYCSQL